jgi:predicted dehydrogenase
MKVVILGSGMYVTGKGQSPTGTILASVMQVSKQSPVDSIHILSKSSGSKTHVDAAAAYTNQILGTSVPVHFTALADKEDGWLAAHLKEEAYDLCINSLPDHLHFAFGKLSLEAGIPTLIVKPLTPTFEEGKQLQEIANQHKTYCAVEFHKRWDESNLYLKKRLQDGALGELLYADVNYSQKVLIPQEQFRAWAHKTNIFQYLGVHYVDLIHFMTGAIPKKLRVYGTKKKLVRDGIDTWDSVHVASVWGQAENEQSNFYAHFNLNWIDPNSTTAMSDQRINLVGTEGRIDCDQKHRGIEEVTSSGGAQSINPYFSSWLADEEFVQLNGYGYRSIATFVQDVERLKKGTVNLEQLEAQRPGIKSSLISTLFIDRVNQLLDSENPNEISL